MADIAASVLAKLKNKSKKTGIGYQKCLQLFFQEEFLRRLAASRYAENFVLKGGLFIYLHVCADETGMDPQAAGGVRKAASAKRETIRIR